MICFSIFHVKKEKQLNLQEENKQLNNEVVIVVGRMLGGCFFLGGLGISYHFGGAQKHTT